MSEPYTGHNPIRYLLSEGKQFLSKHRDIVYPNSWETRREVKLWNTRGNRTSFRKGFIPWNKGYSGYSTSAKGKVIPNDIKQRISQTLKGNQNRTLIPIIQYDLNMNLINQFPSVKEAVKVTGIKQSAISNCLTGRSKIAGKFIWQYMV